MDARAARLAPLLSQTYEAALDPTAWRPLVAQIATAFGGATALYAHDPVATCARIQEFADFQPEFMRSYAAHYGATSPWLHAFRELPVGTLLSRSLVPSLKLETTEYYNDWLRPQNLSDAMGGILGRVGATGSHVTVLRAADRDDFSDNDKQDFRLLLDAMIQAVRVHARLARASVQELALRQALDRAGLAAFVLDANLYLAGYNQLAEGLLRAGHALRCRGERRELATVHPPANDALRRAVALACGTLQARTVLLPQPGSDNLPLVGFVIPMAGSGRASFAVSGTECALLLVKDPSHAPAPGADLLRQVFALTPAEARLTEALAAGRNLDEIGDDRGTSPATLRVQLKSVMSKTGTRRQGELIALAHRTAAMDFGSS